MYLIFQKILEIFVIISEFLVLVEFILCVSSLAYFQDFQWTWRVFLEIYPLLKSLVFFEIFVKFLKYFYGF